MEVKNEKKVLALSFLGVITFIAVIVGATYAYFTAQGGGTGNINVNANTATTDNLSFQVGSAISLTANQEDFGSGAGNKSGSTFARATLTANNATNNATRNYYIYLDIESNNFEYTTGDEQAELLLKVTAPDGTEVTTLGNLERKTSGGETGFDITTSQGLITIADNYEITSTGTVTQDWTVEVIFANLDSDQNANTGKSFSANLIIQEEPMQARVNLASYITDTLYTEDGENGLYYHDGLGDYVNADQEAGDNSYRYSGANPNNYICFGSEAEICPTDNLYRIIGVFGDQVKLIKADFATSTLLGIDGAYSSSIYYYWNNNTNTNTWSESNLNTINLNTNYINNIGRTWSDLIAQHTWQVGGGDVDALLESTTKTAYNIEMNSGTTYNAKIGLMYLNDYGYATIPQYWNYDYWSYSAASEDNWLNHANNEWTITRLTDDFHDNSVVHLALMMDYENTSVSDTQADIYDFAIRPTFYIQSWVMYSSGDGTQENPFRIVV